MFLPLSSTTSSPKCAALRFVFLLLPSCSPSGLGVTMLRETPSYALYFAAYETVKSGGTSLIAAALASGALAVSTGEVVVN